MNFISHRSIGNIAEEWAVRIPDEVTFEQAAFMPLGEIALQGVRKARIELGEKVAVLGLGLIGQLALQFASLSGASPAVGIDRVEKRMNIALDCGAEQVINSGSDDWLEALGSKPPVVIESTGSADAMVFMQSTPCAGLQARLRVYMEPLQPCSGKLKLKILLWRSYSLV